jgi:hypothetical protein
LWTVSLVSSPWVLWCFGALVWQYYTPILGEIKIIMKVFPACHMLTCGNLSTIFSSGLRVILDVERVSINEGSDT